MSNLQQIIKYSENNNVIQRVKSLLDKDASVFITSVVNVSRGSVALQKCSPDSVWGAAIKAASLKLPIEPSLGYAYVIPYGQEAQFQLGYKGLIQLAIRTGLYKKIHATSVFADEIESYNPITNELTINPNQSEHKQRYDGKSEPAGYYALLELLTGFRAEIYMTKRDVENHGKRYSPSYNSKSSAWKTDFEAMAQKTVLKQLLSRYGILSVEMQKAFVAEAEAETQSYQEEPQETPPPAPEAKKKKKDDNVIDVEPEPAKEKEEEPDPFD